MIAATAAIRDPMGSFPSSPTVPLPVPEYVYLATDNARCSQAELTIQEGDHVYLGQTIGTRDGGFFKQPIHATVSGVFDGYEEHYHRSGKKVRFIRIKNDFKDEWDPLLRQRSDEEIDRLTRADYAKILMDCASVGLGGSSFPTHVKFQHDKSIDAILINAIECEPFISADLRLMAEEPEKILRGISYLQKAFSCKKALICVKKKHKDTISFYQKLLSSKPDSGIEVCSVGNFYPQGWEVAMIKSALGIEVAPGKLPSEYGVANFNVSTVWGIADMVKYGRTVVERRISVGGDGIVKPQTFLVRVGTPMKDLLDRCGGYSDPDGDKVFILGGPMMGASLPSDDCIITKTVTSVIVFNRKAQEESPCIRCGSCVYSCPTGLEPKQIMDAVKSLDKQRIKALNPLRCIECGLCSYVCTSHIRVTDYVRRAKVFAKAK